MKRLISALLCAVLALSLAGCAGAGDPITFTWIVDAIPANLDPQLAAASAEVTACTHLYQGLYRTDADGAPIPALAESHTLSADGRTYTFALRQGVEYVKRSNKGAGCTVTADDFVFAFRRIFRTETASPYATTFGGIENGMAVLTGQMPEDALGVRALDDHTLEIRLAQPDDSFLEKLCLPGAAPCDEAYFESTGGKYGLDKDHVISAGTFYLYNWTESGLFLRREPSGNAVNNLRLVTNTDARPGTPAQMIENGKATAMTDTGAAPTGLAEQPYSHTTWSLVLNCKGVFANADLRKALAAAAQKAPLPADTALYGSTGGILPAAARVDGLPYRERAGSAIAVIEDGAAHWAAARSSVAVQKLQGLAILVPDTADALFVQELNSLFQKEYGLYFNIQTLPLQEFAQKYQTGNFDLALAPVQLTAADPTALLSSFTAGPTHYTADGYPALVQQAAALAGADKLDLLAQAEQQLTAQAVVTPLYRQNARLLIADGVKGVRFDPFGPVIDVNWATGTP